MGRPKNANKCSSKHLYLSNDLVAKVELLLYSPLEGKVPHGAWKEFITQAIQEKLERAMQEKFKDKMLS